MYTRDFEFDGKQHTYTVSGPNNARASLLSGGSGLLIDEKTRVDAFLAQIDGKDVWKVVTEKDDEGKIISQKFEVAHDFMLIEAMWNDAMRFSFRV